MKTRASQSKDPLVALTALPPKADVHKGETRTEQFFKYHCNQYAYKPARSLCERLDSLCLTGDIQFLQGPHVKGSKACHNGRDLFGHMQMQ